MPTAPDPPSRQENALAGRELRRRLYLVALSLIVPGAFTAIMVGFSTPGVLRSFTATLASGWALLFLGLLLRLVSNRVVEWTTLILGIVMFYVNFVASLMNWPGSQPLAVMAAASLIPPWASLALRDRIGLRVSYALRPIP